MGPPVLVLGPQEGLGRHGGGAEPPLVTPVPRLWTPQDIPAAGEWRAHRAGPKPCPPQGPGRTLGHQHREPLSWEEGEPGTWPHGGPPPCSQPPFLSSWARPETVGAFHRAQSRGEHSSLRPRPQEGPFLGGRPGLLCSFCSLETCGFQNHQLWEWSRVTLCGGRWCPPEPPGPRGCHRRGCLRTPPWRHLLGMLTQASKVAVAVRVTDDVLRPLPRPHEGPGSRLACT